MKIKPTQYYYLTEDSMNLRSGKVINGIYNSELITDINAMINKTNKYFKIYNPGCAYVYCLIDILNKHFELLKNNNAHVIITLYYTFKYKTRDFIEQLGNITEMCGCDDIERMNKEDKTLKMIETHGPGNYHFSPPVSLMHPEGDMEADRESNMVWVTYNGIEDPENFIKLKKVLYNSWRHNNLEQLRTLMHYDALFKTPHPVYLDLFFKFASKTNNDCAKNILKFLEM